MNTRNAVDGRRSVDRKIRHVDLSIFKDPAGRRMLRRFGAAGFEFVCHSLVDQADNLRDAGQLASL